MAVFCLLMKPAKSTGEFVETLERSAPLSSGALSPAPTPSSGAITPTLTPSSDAVSPALTHPRGWMNEKFCLMVTMLMIAALLGVSCSRWFKSTVPAGKKVDVPEKATNEINHDAEVEVTHQQRPESKSGKERTRFMALGLDNFNDICLPQRLPRRNMTAKDEGSCTASLQRICR